MPTVTPDAVVTSSTVPTPHLAVEGGEARIAREAIVVALTDDPSDVEAHIVREAVVAAHHYPEENTDMRLSRLGVYGVISRPHGWS